MNVKADCTASFITRKLQFNAFLILCKEDSTHQNIAHDVYIGGLQRAVSTLSIALSLCNTYYILTAQLYKRVVAGVRYP
jgi:hypothetical protein